MTMWIILQPRCKAKWLQAVIGRWVSNFIVRRPAFVCFDQVWSFLSSSPHGRHLPGGVKDEVIMATSLIPLLCTDMRLAVDPYPIATDASETGG